MAGSDITRSTLKKGERLLNKYVEYLQSGEGRMDTSTCLEKEQAHTYMLVGQ